MIGRFFHACLSRSSDDIDSFGADALGGDDPDNVGTCRELLHVDAQLVGIHLGAVHLLTHGVEYRDLFHALGFNVHLAVCGVGIDLGSIVPVANTHAVLHDNAHAGAAFIAARDWTGGEHGVALVSIVPIHSDRQVVAGCR